MPNVHIPNDERGDDSEADIVKRVLRESGLGKKESDDLGVSKATHTGAERILAAAEKAKPNLGGKILLLEGSEALQTSEASETSLDAGQIEWVKGKIKADYENSKATIGKLKDGDKPLPDEDFFIRNALNGLTRPHVEFMMREDIAPFGFKIKPVYSSINRLKGLVDSHPATMSIPDGQAQQSMKIWPEAEEHLVKSSTGNDDITDYEWEFAQDQQIIKPFPGDDLKQPIGARALLFKQHLPKGMRGTDRRTWSISEADGLRNGKPLDCKFANDAKDTDQYETWNFTVLDEESEFLTKDQVRCLVGGNFAPVNRRAYLDVYSAAGPDDSARFRASVSGLCKVP